MKIVPLEPEEHATHNIIYINSKNGNSAHYCGNAMCEMDQKIELGGLCAAITDNISLAHSSVSRVFGISCAASGSGTARGPWPYDPTPY